MDTALRSMSDAVLAIARYAATGIPDGEGGFATFVTSGMTDAQYEALGELPRTHAMLGAMLLTPDLYRASSLQEDLRFEGSGPRPIRTCARFSAYRSSRGTR